MAYEENYRMCGLDGLRMLFFLDHFKYVLTGPNQPGLYYKFFTTGTGNKLARLGWVVRVKDTSLESRWQRTPKGKLAYRQYNNGMGFLFDRALGAKGRNAESVLAEIRVEKAKKAKKGKG